MDRMIDSMIGILRHLFVPHESNNHKAKVLHVDSLLVYVLLFALVNLCFRAIHQSYPDILGYATDIRIEELLRLVNDKRRENGLGELKLNSALSQAAQSKAADMFSKNYWAHIAPDGKSPWDFIVASGYRYTVAGENLAKNFSTSGAVVDAWMASPSHKDNLLKSAYEDIGFAIVNGTLNGEETTLVVQMFGTGTQALAQAPQQKIVKEVIAQEPTVKPTIVAKVQKSPTPTITPQPIIVTTEADMTEQEQVTADLPILQIASVQHPNIDIPSINKYIVVGFLTFMLSMFVLDMWYVRQKKIMRVAGHNLAHFLFFLFLFTSILFIGRGTIL